MFTCLHTSAAAAKYTRSRYLRTHSLFSPGMEAMSSSRIMRPPSGLSRAIMSCTRMQSNSRATALA